ncbi:MAG TPA: hypothetical protein PKC91_12370 [Ignavibacteria bacterium]|nr:hypothetical protein [Ignavibacteria bacterium]
MNLLPKLILSIFLALITSVNLFSQPKQDFILKEVFVPFLDSLVLPPSNCDEAISLMVFDSSNMEYEYSQLLNDQDSRITKLFTDLTINLNLNKMDKSRTGQPPGGNGPTVGNGPPAGNGPPGGMGPPSGNMGDIQDQFIKMKDDLEDANTAVDKITVEKENFKDELTQMQAEVNNKLHKTLETEDVRREQIINELLSAGSAKYKKSTLIFRTNMLVIDQIVKKYGYGAKVKILPLKSEILKLQMTEITILKFLLNVTKEFANIGTKFYIRE